MDRHDSIPDLIELVYDAAYDPSQWPVALERLTAELRGTRAGLFVQDGTTHMCRGTATGQPIEGKDYSDYAAINPCWPPTYSAPVGSVMIDRVAAGRSVYLRSEYFNDFCVPQDMFAAIAVKVLHDGAASGVVTVTRGRCVGEFGAADSEYLGRLCRHLRRAVQVNRELAPVSVATTGALAAFDRLAQAAIIVNAEARVLFANKAADRILNAGDGLRSVRGGLCGNAPKQTTELRRLIANATRPGETDCSGGWLTLTRASGRRPLSVLVAPASSEKAASWPLWAIMSAVVFVTDPEASQATTSDRLRRLYGLTCAEAAVALAVLRGEKLKSIAEELCVARATVVTHLSHVFAKTGVRRQTQLIRLILESQIAVLESESGRADRDSFPRAAHPL